MHTQFLPDSWFWEALASGARRGHYMKHVMIPDVAVSQLDGIDLLESSKESGIVQVTHFHSWAEIADIWQFSLSAYPSRIDPSVTPVCIMHGRKDEAKGRTVSSHELQRLSLADESAAVAVAIIPTDLLSVKGLLIAEQSYMQPTRTEYLPFDRSLEIARLDGILEIKDAAAKSIVLDSIARISEFLETCYSIKLTFLKAEFLQVGENAWLKRVSSVSFVEKIPRAVNCACKTPGPATDAEAMIAFGLTCGKCGSVALAAEARRLGLWRERRQLPDAALADAALTKLRETEKNCRRLKSPTLLKTSLARIIEITQKSKH
jgi:hypothetical protein